MKLPTEMRAILKNSDLFYEQFTGRCSRYAHCIKDGGASIEITIDPFQTIDTS